MRNVHRIVAMILGLAAFSAVSAHLQGQPKPKVSVKPVKPAEKSGAEGAKQGETSTKAAPEKEKDAKAETSTGDSADEAAIRRGADQFVEVYNAHNAQAVSELFAPKAEFTDEDGNLIKGREAISQDFARMFADNPQCKIQIEVGSIRILSPNIAVEEGIVRGLTAPDEAENISSYLAVHVKVDGRWQIASVNDYEAESGPLTGQDHLQELAWMVGDWIDESPDAIVKTSCGWDNSGNYLLHEFVIESAGILSASGSMRIGWDPLAGQIKSWTFDADSGYAEGLWSRTDDEWTLKSQGVNGEGKPTSATVVFRFVDNDTMTWRSYDRVVGGAPAADIPELIIKRHAPPPAE